MTFQKQTNIKVSIIQQRVKIIHHHELQLYKLSTISIIIEEIIESESIIIEAME